MKDKGLPPSDFPPSMIPYQWLLCTFQITVGHSCIQLLSCASNKHSSSLTLLQHWRPMAVRKGWSARTTNAKPSPFITTCRVWAHTWQCTNATMVISGYGLIYLPKLHHSMPALEKPPHCGCLLWELTSSSTYLFACASVSWKKKKVKWIGLVELSLDTLSMNIYPVIINMHSDNVHPPSMQVETGDS